MPLIARVDLSPTLTIKEAAFGGHIFRLYVRQKHSPTDNRTLSSSFALICAFAGPSYVFLELPRILSQRKLNPSPALNFQMTRSPVSLLKLVLFAPLYSGSES